MGKLWKFFGRRRPAELSQAEQLEKHVAEAFGHPSTDLTWQQIFRYDPKRYAKAEDIPTLDEAIEEKLGYSLRDKSTAELAGGRDEHGNATYGKMTGPE